MMLGWREKALALGWSTQELDTLQDLLESPHREVAVEHVGRWAMQLCSRATFKIDGTDKHGTTHTHALPFERRYLHHRRPTAGLIRAQADDLSSWCPIHADQCAHSTRGCVRQGEQPVIGLEIGDYKLNFEKSAVVSAPTTEVLHARPVPARKKRREALYQDNCFCQVKILTGRLPLPHNPRQ